VAAAAALIVENPLLAARYASAQDPPPIGIVGAGIGQAADQGAIADALHRWEQARAPGLLDRLAAIVYPQLAVEVDCMPLYGTGGDAKPRGDLLVALARGQRLQNLPLAS
jgi:hypothetical protein